MPSPKSDESQTYVKRSRSMSYLNGSQNGSQMFDVHIQMLNDLNIKLFLILDIQISNVKLFDVRHSDVK